MKNFGRPFRVIAFFISFAVPLSSAASEETPSKQYKVKVDGKKYRIKVKGSDVYVSDKSILSAANLESRDRMRKAVFIATGCVIVDDFWLEARLAGKIDCSNKVADSVVDH